MPLLMEKHIKFLTIREAIREIIESLLRPDCVEEAAEIFSFLEGGEAKSSKGTHPLAENKIHGIIYKPKASDDEEFYHWSEFEDLLTQALERKLPEDIALIPLSQPGRGCLRRHRQVRSLPGRPGEPLGQLRHLSRYTPARVGTRVETPT